MPSNAGCRWSSVPIANSPKPRRVEIVSNLTYPHVENLFDYLYGVQQEAYADEWWLSDDLANLVLSPQYVETARDLWAKVAEFGPSTYAFHDLPVSSSEPRRGFMRAMRLYLPYCTRYRLKESKRRKQPRKYRIYSALAE